MLFNCDTFLYEFSLVCNLKAKIMSWKVNILIQNTASYSWLYNVVLRDFEQTAQHTLKKTQKQNKREFSVLTAKWEIVDYLISK